MDVSYKAKLHFYGIIFTAEQTLIDVYLLKYITTSNQVFLIVKINLILCSFDQYSYLLMYTEEKHGTCCHIRSFILVIVVIG